MNNSKLQNKIFLLKRLVELYVTFMKLHNNVEVKIINNNTIKVRYFSSHLKNEFNTNFAESVEFPVSHISKRILHYKQKIRTEFKNRHKTRYYLYK